MKRLAPITVLVLFVGLLGAAPSQGAKAPEIFRPQQLPLSSVKVVKPAAGFAQKMNRTRSATRNFLSFAARRTSKYVGRPQRRAQGAGEGARRVPERQDHRVRASARRADRAALPGRFAQRRSAPTSERSAGSTAVAARRRRTSGRVRRRMRRSRFGRAGWRRSGPWRSTGLAVASTAPARRTSTSTGHRGGGRAGCHLAPRPLQDRAGRGGHRPYGRARRRLGDRPGRDRGGRRSARPRARAPRADVGGSRPSPPRPTSASTSSWPATRSRPPAPRSPSAAPSRSARRPPRSSGSRRAGRASARDDHRDDPAGGRHQRARRQLHEGLLHRPGDGRPPPLQGQAEPPPARAAARRAGRPPAIRSASASASSARSGTAVLSPALGPIALAILRREAEPGAHGRASAMRSRPRSSSCRSRSQRRAPAAAEAVRLGLRHDELAEEADRCGCALARPRPALAACGEDDFENNPRPPARSSSPRGSTTTASASARTEIGAGLANDHGLEPVRRPGAADPRGPDRRVAATRSRRAAPARSRPRSRRATTRSPPGEARAPRAARSGRPRARELAERAAAALARSVYSARRRALPPRPATRSAARQRSTSATIASSSSRARLGAVGDAGQRLADPVGALEPRRRLLGGVADAGGVDLEASRRGPRGPARRRSGRRAERQRVGLLAVDDDDHLVALVLGQLLAPGRDLLLAGDHQHARRRRRARAIAALSSAQASFLESCLSLASKTTVAAAGRRSRRSRPRCRPSCRRPRRRVADVVGGVAVRRGDRLERRVDALLERAALARAGSASPRRPVVGVGRAP